MTAAARPGRVELWGGVECTVNRVGDAFFDQLALTGHDRREADLDRLAWLGIAAVRYPVLWERTAPEGPSRADWRWSDARLGGLRARGIRPIVGLVHHGSGPPGTSLVDPAFPEKLAAYAGAVAARYPWVDDWTPVNEPGTTARFAGLYGHWYPHGRDVTVFVRALLNECRATALAMRAIRAVNPGARLVQTEDVGWTTSTPRLAYQADYENERRLLAFDLLTGRVAPGHPLWEHLLEAGATREELALFEAEPCPPDVVGVNYYLTSDRFLDERLERYPASTHGGNGRDRYADVETVRVANRDLVGHAEVLRALWDRYRLPLAITEAHAGCTREEQTRWLVEAWDAARTVRAEGADVRAVTVWSLFGASDWDKLVTRVDGSYEPGAFDVRSSPPRPTALAHCARALAQAGSYAHPTAGQPGWWRRPQRVLHPPAARVAPEAPPTAAGAPILVTGGRGTLARAIARIAAIRGLVCQTVGRAELDITDPAAVRATIEAVRPWAVINAAGYVRVDDAEGDRDRCLRENALGPAILAEACRAHGVRFVTFSSDLVFNGRAARPYAEGAAPDPLGVYGLSKAESERRVRAALPSALVVRTAAFFGPWDEHNFVAQALRTMAAGERFRAVDDLVVSPTYVPDLVNGTLDLLVDDEDGVWHLANEGEISWAALARDAAVTAGLDPELVLPCPAAAAGFVAPRPAYSALGSERGQVLPPLDRALRAFAEARREAEVAAPWAAGRGRSARAAS
jgi:dTDP-4-dehydrorhamnose reductase